jgi:foldase protein PrsA
MATKKPKTKKLKLNLKSRFVKNLILVVLVGSTSFLLAKKYKSQFIVATVNYQPISRFQLNKLLTERYGQDVLDELINQTLIKDLIKKNNVSVTAADIETEIANLKTQLGGEEVFQATLAQYGLTLDLLKEKLEVTLGQKKLAENLFNPEVSNEEVSEYFTQNKALFNDKTLPEVEEEIKANLIDQKLQQEFSTWFTEQKEKASIRSFI